MASKNEIVVVPRSQRKQRRGKKNRKHGRNKEWCKAYAACGQREKNKVKRINKHLAKHPKDAVAKAAKERPRKGA